MRHCRHPCRLPQRRPRRQAVVARVGDVANEVLDARDGVLEALAREVETQRAAAATRDFREGLSAFMEKRPPRFTGN